MYLEISGRGSGKTTRLISTAITDLRYTNCNVVNIVVLDSRQVSYVNQEIKKYSNGLLGDNFNVTFYGRLENHAHGRRYNFDRGKWFFDDFDYHKSNLPLPILKNGYYCTTPKAKRSASAIQSGTDPMSRLLRCNDYKYVNIHSPDEVARRYLHTNGSDMFTVNVKGKFI